MGRIILEDGSQYLPVKFRISEFYQQHPKGEDTHQSDAV